MCFQDFTRFHTLYRLTLLKLITETDTKKSNFQNNSIMQRELYNPIAPDARKPYAVNTKRLLLVNVTFKWTLDVLYNFEAFLLMQTVLSFFTPTDQF